MNKFLISILKKSKGILFFISWFYSLNSFFLIKGRLKNKINYSSTFLKNTKIHVLGNKNIVNIEIENRLQNCLIHVSGNNCEVNIGKHCILANLEIWLEDDGSIITIGSHTTIEGGHIAATEGEKISIGDDCMFSHRIEIRNGDSHAILDLQSNDRINRAREVIIGNHVWLGADVKVLKGSIIENNSIIGTGSIVTGIVDPNSIYVGVPAKKVKSSVMWTRKR